MSAAKGPDVQHYKLALKTHFERFFGATRQVKLPAPNFDYNDKLEALWADSGVLSTLGMEAASSSTTDTRLELFIFAPNLSESLMKILGAVILFHRQEKRLGHGHTVRFGIPIFPGSECDCGLISLPYLDGPDFELFEGNGSKARVLWLLPITESERDFKEANGLEALEKLFEEKHLEFRNPLRASVV